MATAIHPKAHLWVTQLAKRRPNYIDWSGHGFQLRTETCRASSRQNLCHRVTSRSVSDYPQS